MITLIVGPLLFDLNFAFLNFACNFTPFILLINMMFLSPYHHYQVLIVTTSILSCVSTRLVACRLVVGLQRRFEIIVFEGARAHTIFKL